MNVARFGLALSLALPVLCIGACSVTGPVAPDQGEVRSDQIDPTPLDQSVRFVWFVPTDVTYHEATVTAIERAAYNTQSWYRALTDGTTFRFDQDFPVEVVFGDHDRAWYENRANPYGWDPIRNANYWIDMEVKRKLALTDGSPAYKVAIYMSAEGGGGASVGRLVIPQHDVDGIQEGVQNVNRFWGGLAHELGHIFDLPDANGDDGTIMSGALYAYPDADLPDALITAMLDSDCNAGFFTDMGPELEPDAAYMIINAATGMAADLQANDSTDGVPVVERDSTGAATQRWRLERRANGTYLIRSQATGGLFVVAGRSGVSGAKIQQERAGDPAEQAWYVLSLGGGRYEVIALYDIVPNQRTEGLAVPEGAGSGTQLIQQDFVTADRQTWRFVKVE